jgi:hypothetical protein
MSKEKSKPVVHKKPKSHESGGSFFTLLLVLFSLALVAAGVVSFLNIWLAPKLMTEIFLVLGGLILLIVIIKEASGHERRNILKKYI